MSGSESPFQLCCTMARSDAEANINSPKGGWWTVQFGYHFSILIAVNLQDWVHRLLAPSLQPGDEIAFGIVQTKAQCGLGDWINCFPIQAFRSKPENKYKMTKKMPQPMNKQRGCSFAEGRLLFPHHLQPARSRCSTEWSLSSQFLHFQTLAGCPTLEAANWGQKGALLWNTQGKKKLIKTCVGFWKSK